MITLEPLSLSTLNTTQYLRGVLPELLQDSTTTFTTESWNDKTTRSSKTSPQALPSLCIEGLLDTVTVIDRVLAIVISANVAYNVSFPSPFFHSYCISCANTSP